MNDGAVKFFSPRTKQFYSSDVHDEKSIPTDAVKVTDETWQNLLAEQGNGRQIVPDENGNPIAVDGPPLPLAVRQANIRAQLATLESKTLRPMRELTLGLPAPKGEPSAKERLAAFEQQMAELRTQLAALQ